MSEAQIEELEDLLEIYGCPKEVLVRFIGVTGHGTLVAARHRESQERVAPPAWL